MTDSTSFPPRLRAIGWWLVLAAAMAGGCVAACANWHDVFNDKGQVFFVDADCYARMTRVRIVCEHPGVVLTAHYFENYPYGTRPHTTALFDYLIWTLRGVLNVFSRAEMRDVAGAWISPLLGLTAIAGVGIWANRFRLPGRLPIFLVLVGSPILAHGFALGRPDHQSLVLACVACALAAEWALWQKPSRGWGWVSGIAWALGLWTSLYEPLILLGAALAAGLLFNRPALWRRERLPGLAAGGAILLAALAIEGWRVDALPGFGQDPWAAYFEPWSRQIGELAHVPVFDPAMFRWTGWGLLVAPILLLLPRHGMENDELLKERRLANAHAFLLVLVWGLTCWQMRWNYFLPLMYALSIPWQLGAFPARWRAAASVVLIGGLWPMATEWREFANPTAERAAQIAEQHDERDWLRKTADQIKTDSVAITPGTPVAEGILAPWWLCPALSYWSGQPAVAGSSHESLHGIVDTARFYMETDARNAAALLRERRVRWVVAYEPERVLEATAAPLLGKPVPLRCMGNLLYKHPLLAPTFLRVAQDRPYFKVYEVLPTSLP